MRFIKIGETYAVNADRIMDATYTARGYEETGEGVGEHTRASVTIRLAGATEVDGRRAYRLTSGFVEAFGRGEERIDFVVDAETYLPLSQRVVTDVDDGPTVDIRTRYRVYERLPLDDTTDRLLALDPHPDAKCSQFAHELTEERDLGFPNPCR
jgi:hypothetical protein